jgi:Putative Flp pilus-assembly TadE/G-like
MRYPIHGNARRDGKVIALVAISLMALVGMLAISLDGGALQSERRHEQAATDAAALSAAADLFYRYWQESGWDPNHTASQCAFDTAAAHGYTNDGINSRVTVNIPPAGGFYAGRPGYVEVIIDSYQKRAFSGAIGDGNLTVSTRAVALGQPIAANVGILVLDPLAKSAFNAGGGGVITVQGTPIIVDSVDPEAATVNGGTQITAFEYDITGGAAEIGGGVFNGPLYTNQMPMADPFADLPPPDKSTMVVRENNAFHQSNGSYILQPGVYKGGISLSGTASVTLMPGIYYMDRGGFQFSGMGSLIGNGVLIYTDPGNGNSQDISITGQGVMQLSPMMTGPYAGLTFWQRRDATVAGTIAGNGSNTSIVGTFYFAGALLNISGNGGLQNIGSQYVSNTLNLGGNGIFNVNWTPYTVARQRTITLVE